MFLKAFMKNSRGCCNDTFTLWIVTADVKPTASKETEGQIERVKTFSSLMGP